MAQKVLIMGESGTGKSTSLRNCKPELIGVVNPVGKPLPFKGKFDMLENETDARKITKWMKEQVAAGKKILVVDDFQYILSVPYMNRIQENGWDKWNDFGANYFEIIEVCKSLPDDVVVYYMTHTETLENGTTTIKLIGKLLREKITIEGLFTIVLRTGVNEGKYYFYTQNSGKDTVKSPVGMFPTYAIDNDLAYVDDKIRNYYEFGNFKSDAEMAAEDKAAASDIEKPDANGRRRRGSAKTESTGVSVQEDKPSTGRTRRSRSTQEQQQTQEEQIEDSAVNNTFEGEQQYMDVSNVQEQDGLSPEQPKQRTRRSRNQQAQENANANAIAQGDALADDPRDEVPFEEAEQAGINGATGVSVQEDKPSTGRTRRTRKTRS